LPASQQLQVLLYALHLQVKLASSDQTRQLVAAASGAESSAGK
jgi:hypothetical protein